jgi:hypothetical protein
MTSSRWITLGVFLAALLAVAAAAIVLLPRVRVLSVTPAAEADVPVTAPLQIAFSVPMDPASVQAHLRIEPETSGSATVDGRRFVWRPDTAWAPGIAYTVTLQAGAASAAGRTLIRGQTWSFRTRAPGLLYLGRSAGAAGIRQIYVAALDDSMPMPITAAPYGVWDLAVHPQGQAVVYSALREDGGSDLWLLELDGRTPDTQPHQLLACPEAACLAPAWSPDSRQIAYERRDIFAGAPNLDPQAGRLWLLDVASEKTSALFEYDVPLHSAAWAPDSRRLAYVSPLAPGIEVLDLVSGEITPFPNEWGTAPVWSPGTVASGEDELVVPDLALLDEPQEALVVHLFGLDLDSRQPTNLTAPGDVLLVKDTGPAWSPGGGWIAFSRQSFEADTWTSGRQIWLMRPGGAEAYAVIGDPGADLFGLAWRPDGGALAYLRVDVSAGPQTEPQVGIWLYDFGQKRSSYVADGVMARWLP